VLERISQAYADADQERYRHERAISICSEEMSELNAHLSAERDRLYTIVTSMREGLCVVDAEAELAFANPAAARMLGAPLEGLVGRSFYDFVDDAELARVRAHFMHGAPSVQSEELRLSTANGAIDVAISIARLHGENAGSVVIFRDVRERKAALDALRASEQRFRAIFESAAVGILRSSLDGAVLQCNAAYAKMIGMTPEELEGQRWMDHIHPEEREAAEALTRRVGSIDAPLIFERRLVNRAGATVWAALSVSTVCDANGTRLFKIAIARDITEQRHLEISLRHAQRLEAVGRLAAGVAHEINTPIQFVGDNLAFLRTAHADLVRAYAAVRARAGAEHEQALLDVEREADLAYLVDECPRAIQQSLEGIGHVAEIVGAMKVFSHQDRSSDQTQVDLNAALRSVVTVARSETKHVAEVILDLGDVPPVLAFPSDLNQVFLNLLVNAAHAVADAARMPGTIRVRSRVEGDDAIVTVEDTGTGIAENVRGRIFDPFFTTKEVGRGTGQGLALARAIVVDKHKGSLTFETEVGRGTTFVVRLPVGGRARTHGVAA
jgi:PAS domain S-box-containing protein